MPNEEIKTITNTGNPRPGSIPPKPPPGGTNTKPPPRPQGRGNLLYVCAGNTGSAVGGVAKCVGAYAGTPVWSAINGGLTTAAQKNFYGINFDPFSLNSAGTQFKRMWGLNQDGLYLCTGLDGTPTWSKKLDSSAASTLLGTSVTLGESFTPNVRIANQILATAYQYQGGGANDWDKYWILKSNDLGATWSGNGAYYLKVSRYFGQIGKYGQIVCSNTHTGTYYFAGAFGNQAGDFTLPGGYSYCAARSTDLLNWAQIQVSDNATYPTLIQPYCNPGGTSVYVNDNVMYLYGNSSGSVPGLAQLKRYSSFETYSATPSIANVGSASMPGWSGSYPPSPYYFFPHTFNENYIVGARGDGVYTSNENEIWVSTNRGSTWTLRRPSVTGRTDLNAPRNLYLVLADEKIFYILGHNSSGAVYVAKSLDLGATFTDVSRWGTANYLDTVLGTVDYAHQIILVDYYKA